VYHYLPGRERLRVRTDEAGQPALVAWGRRLHRVQAVHDRRESRLDWWLPTGPAHRVYYLVETDHGALLELYHDLAGGSWFLARELD
jgi:hypothetical protein